MSLLFLYSGRTKKNDPSSDEHAAFLPVSTQNMAQHNMSPYHDYRWSGDSGQGTERSSTAVSRDISPTDPHRFAKHEDDVDGDEEGVAMSMPVPQGHIRFRIKVVDKFLSKRIPGLFSARLLKAIEVAYEVVDRTILILGFIALTSGGVTYTGIFVSGLASSLT